MTTSLGQWKNAPLALVLAQIRFESFMDLDAVAKPFRERIEKLYPRFQPMLAQTLPNGVVLNTPAGGYEFYNVEKTQCVRLELGALTYFVTDYVEYPGHFEEEWRTLVSHLSGIKEVFVTRAGLRYIDFIMPSAGKAIEDYVASPFGRHADVPNAEFDAALDLHVFKMKEGVMRVQFGCGYGRPALPPDLQNFSLKESEIMARAFVGRSAVLDTDRVMNPSCFASPEMIMEMFGRMHDDVSAAFQNVVTPFARSEWRAPQHGG